MVNPQPDYAEAIAYALERLRAELSPDLLYHTVWHTEHDVMPSALRLARLTDHVGEEDRCLLEVAAAYHDLGFVEQAKDHEMIAARLVAQTLPALAFSSRQIECIMSMILATRLPQSPRTVLEQILADADLDVLGRDDFFPRNAALLQESIRLGRPFTQVEWDRQQLNFLQKHTYFTAAARALRGAGKQQHIAQLEQRLHRADDL